MDHLGPTQLLRGDTSFHSLGPVLPLGPSLITLVGADEKDLLVCHNVNPEHHRRQGLQTSFSIPTSQTSIRSYEANLTHPRLPNFAMLTQCATTPGSGLGIFSKIRPFFHWMRRRILPRLICITTKSLCSPHSTKLRSFCRPGA